MSLVKDFLSKYAYNEEDAMKVLRAAKKRTLPRAANRFLIHSMEQSSGIEVPEDIKKRIKSSFLSYPSPSKAKKIIEKQTPEVRNYLRGEYGKTNIYKHVGRVHKGGGIILPHKGHDTSNFMRFVRSLGGNTPKGKFTPSQHKMLSSIARGHELDELKVKPSIRFASHHSPDVVFREHNRLVTMPKGHENIKRTFQNLRYGTGEAQALDYFLPKGSFSYGESPRLSRHARKRLTNIVEKQMEGMQKLVTDPTSKGGK